MSNEDLGDNYDPIDNQFQTDYDEEPSLSLKKADSLEGV